MDGPSGLLGRLLRYAAGPIATKCPPIIGAKESGGPVALRLLWITTVSSASFSPPSNPHGIFRCPAIQVQMED